MNDLLIISSCLIESEIQELELKNKKFFIRDLFFLSLSLSFEFEHPRGQPLKKNVNSSLVNFSFPLLRFHPSFSILFIAMQRFASISNPTETF